MKFLDQFRLDWERTTWGYRLDLGFIEVTVDLDVYDLAQTQSLGMKQQWILKVNGVFVDKYYRSPEEALTEIERNVFDSLIDKILIGERKETKLKTEEYYENS